MTTNSLIEFARLKGKNPPFNLSEVMPKDPKDPRNPSDDMVTSSLRKAMDL